MRILKSTLGWSLLSTALLSAAPAHAQAPSPQLRYTVHLSGVLVDFDGREQIRHSVGTGTVVLRYHATAPSITDVQLNYSVSIGIPDIATTRAINGRVFDFMAHVYTGPGISVRTSHAHGAWTVLIKAYHRSFQDHAAQCISARGGYVGRTVLEVHAGYVDRTGKSSVPCGPSTAFRDRVYRALVAQAHGQ
jgi:hypothetical protein